MRHPSIYTQRRQSLDVKMTPMIDVVFLLLIFFVWTASFQIAEHVLPSRISETKGAEAAQADQPPPPEADFHEIVVRILWIDGSPAWRINDRPCEGLEQLNERLRLIYAAKEDAPVIIHPDDDTPLGAVIQVYDLSRLIGFQKVQFAVEE